MEREENLPYATCNLSSDEITNAAALMRSTFGISDVPWQGKEETEDYLRDLELLREAYYKKEKILCVLDTFEKPVDLTSEEVESLHKLYTNLKNLVTPEV